MAIAKAYKIDDKLEHKINERVRLATMTKEEVNYLKRKRLFDMVWPIFRFLILFGLCFVIMYPLIFMISCAFRQQSDMNDPTVMWIPRNLTLSVIQETAEAMDFGTTLKNTLFLNLGCSLVQVASCSLTGYGFARFKFKGKSLLFGLVVLMILVPQQIILSSQYMQFRHFMGTQLNLIDTYWTMYLPAIMGNGIRAGLMILLFRQFFKGLPRELEDAAYLDGCSPFKTFILIMVPNMSSAFLIVFLFSVVWYWNDYYVSSSFLNNTHTIALMLNNLDAQLNTTVFAETSSEVSVREKIVWMEAGCLISITPILVMYCFLQKKFTEGIARAGLVG
jgi:multiple sugar transport system permease protein